MARHHYVPQFLLRNWSNGEGRIVAYYFQPQAKKVIENDKASVASACQIENLNRYLGVAPSQSDFPEVGFFTPRVDTPAAGALQTMLAKGVRSLTAEQRSDWARLLVSFAVRTPETLREMGPAETKKAFELLAASAKGAVDDERAVTAIIEQNMQKLARNFPLNAAMELSVDPVKLAKVTAMDWWIRRWPKTAILIGDRPVLTHPKVKYPCGIPLDSRSCLIALPIAPNAVFFASANLKTRNEMRSMALGRVARILNEQTISRSTTVFTADKSLASFVTPRVHGKATGTWEPLEL
jgi:hypothetical protein